MRRPASVPRAREGHLRGGKMDNNADAVDEAVLLSGSQRADTRRHRSLEAVCILERAAHIAKPAILRGR